ncbi:MAG: bifunctional folylpolyglutamate synthase/dihydrofolate synthase [Chitinophagaceae bacterium]|nr:MAG: bifunctional folylpolyglutamate synthase/dihydrofolate synthase [Chitinophagaceae bacterium]
MFSATYSQTIEYLFSRLPLFSRIGAAAMKNDLNNITALCNFLGNPQQQLKSIHVAGTNGKGSVSHMLASILQTAGYKTGLHTSPHLKDFRERIKINGEVVSKEFVIEFTERIKPLIEKLNPSFFEISVAMTFEYFAQQKVDIAIIEVGLGGRLDSTNIITPELSIITSIGMDHTNLLGDTLEKIAFEKAGIIKNEVPVIIGEFLSETKPVFESIATKKNAPLIFATENRNAIGWTWEKHKLSVEVEEKNKPDHKLYELDLLGIYQTKNLLTVIESCAALNRVGIKISDSAIAHGLSHTKKITGLHGRWEIIQEHPLIILDVAHNEDGIIQLIRQIEITDFHQLHLVIGFVKDKEIDKILQMLPQKATYYFTQANTPRAISSIDLKVKASNLNLLGDAYTSVNIAIQAAKSKASSKDLILVCGSVYLIGEVT